MAQSWIRGTNANVERSITVLWAKSVNNDFHARFSAVSRRYLHGAHIAGVLMDIGAGERSPAWAGEVLEARDRE